METISNELYYQIFFDFKGTTTLQREIFYKELCRKYCASFFAIVKDVSSHSITLGPLDESKSEGVHGLKKLDESSKALLINLNPGDVIEGVVSHEYYEDPEPNISSILIKFKKISSLRITVRNNSYTLFDIYFDDKFFKLFGGGAQETTFNVVIPGKHILKAVQKEGYYFRPTILTKEVFLGKESSAVTWNFP